MRASGTEDPPGTMALNAHALAFSSSLVVAGEGTGVVIRTGNQTMIGSIASLAAGTAGAGATLLQREVHRFVMLIACLAVVTGVTLFVIGLARAAAIHNGTIPRAAFVNALVNGACGLRRLACCTAVTAVHAWRRIHSGDGGERPRGPACHSDVVPSHHREAYGATERGHQTHGPCVPSR